MTRRDKIRESLRSLEPSVLEVYNESDQHAGPPGRESHFRVRIVSTAFDGQLRIKRHRQVHRLLEAVISDGVHALALELYTEAEWAQRNAQGVESPPCQGVRKL